MENINAVAGWVSLAVAGALRPTGNDPAELKQSRLSSRPALRPDDTVQKRQAEAAPTGCEKAAEYKAKACASPGRCQSGILSGQQPKHRNMKCGHVPRHQKRARRTRHNGDRKRYEHWLR